MTVYDNIAFGLRARGLPEDAVRERVARIARVAGVEHILSKPAWMLSGGEAQRTALARALAVEPRLLLLDEALDRIDAGTRAQLVALVRRYVDEHDAVALLVTHHIGDVVSTVPVDAMVVL
jgi:ABC-type sugar transport system ATPase subunit